MSYALLLVFSFSIAIAAVIGGIRFKKINPAYYPFIFCIWIAFLNELLGSLLISNGYSNAANNNIYVIIESLLITWQFQRWNLFDRRKFLFFLIFTSFLFSWAIEIIFFNSFHYTISYFRIFYSFVIVLMSITMIGRLLLYERIRPLRNPIFLTCIAFVIYFMNKVIIGMFWLYGLRLTGKFAAHVAIILVYINLFTNLIYALAVLWIPTKHRFLLQS